MTIPDENLTWVAHLPEGWHPLYLSLITDIAEIDPAATVSQAKQKLGELRVYLQRTLPEVEPLIRTAEARSRTLCELCGGAGELRIDPHGWHRTLCEEHGSGFSPARLGRTIVVSQSEMPQAIAANASALPWPIFALDFEASGLGEFTYPIELGIARWNRPEAPIEIWSALIKPTQAWRRHRTWMPGSEAIHGIAREELERGITPEQALHRANTMIGTHVAYCDGGESDLRWLRHLAHAVRTQPSFELAAWERLEAAMSAEQRSTAAAWRSGEPIAHRAGEDAKRLLLSLAVGLAHGR